jgi:hypothetical protein
MTAYTSALLHSLDGRPQHEVSAAGRPLLSSGTR